MSKTITDMSLEDISNYIRKHLPIRREEKDKFGEVFTPIHLIDEILDALPNNVWSNPKLKWLDPAAGVGNFGLLVYYRLMNGLKSKIPNLKKRSTHILENMLYQVELNPQNAQKIKHLFGKNIFEGSFLEDVNGKTHKVNSNMLKHFGVNKFDVIMGNPPYQRSMESHQKKGTNAGRQTLWDKFILAGFDILNPDGYLAYITPNSWRGLGKLGYLWKMLSEKRVLYLHIYGMKAGIQEFGASTRFDLFVIQNTVSKKHSTLVIDELGNRHHIDLSQWPFFPNYAYREIKNILTTPDKGFKVIYDTSYHTQHTNEMSQQKDKKFRYPVVHSITKEGLGFWYTDKKKAIKGHFGTPKVLLNFNQFQYPYNDYKGEYGMSQLTFGLPIKSRNEGDALVKALDSDTFKKIIKATKWGVFQTDWRMFKYFKPDFYKKYNKTHKRKSPKKKNKTRRKY
jgi:hypothetical protein